MPGAAIFSRQAAPIPDRPAPTISTSTCSAAMSAGWHWTAELCNTSDRCITCEEPAMTAPVTQSSLVTPSSSAEIDDGPAIAELHRLFARQRAAFLADAY